ncbi:erythromycin resistance leader peptide [Oceanobacillus sp. ISL-73]|nr:erythromycin resistance leader peptide [Oceanobacillus sp. ISL-73]
MGIFSICVFKRVRYQPDQK